ncbi:MAG TPA: ATP-binding cassette domain-containing protein [Longimicrobiales bacterium]|nr:ATP-binding cassette domain-containing protein [Longimicrobiales bacterium]
MIEFRDLHKGFGGRPVLRGIDLVVREGETLALLGPSGTGKSVLLKHVVGLLEPDAGDVLVDGISIAQATDEELQRVRRRVGYVFQNAALFDSLTVAENLWLAQDDGRGSRSLAACRGEAIELLRRVNLEPVVLEQRPAELSGGMRKRVGVARAIASRPSYLLWDEPTTGLDPVNADTVDELILELGQGLGVTSIVVTHDLDTAFEVGDRIALLYEGRIRACEPPARILESPDPIVQRFVRRRRSSDVPDGPTAAALPG